MPTVTRTIEIVFGAINRTGGVIAEVGSGLDNLASSVGKVTGPMASVTDSILKMDAALATAAAAVLAFGYKASVDFSGAFADIRKVLGAGETDLDGYRQTIYKLSNQYAVSAVDVAKSAAQFKQSGFTIKESFDLVEQSLVSANVSELDAAQSAEYMVRILAGFRGEASDAAHVLDILNETSNNYGSTVGMLSDGLAVVAASAKAAGMGYEETVSYITPIIEVFKSGSEAGNALSIVLQRIANPNKKLRELMDELGVKTTDANGAMRQTKDILGELVEKIGKRTDAEKLQMGGIVAGAEQSKRFNVLLGDTAHRQEILEKATSSAGSATRELAVAMEKEGFQLERIKNGLSTLAVGLGDEYRKEGNDAVTAVADLMAAIGKTISGDNAEQLFIVLRGALEEFASEVKETAKNLPAAFEMVDLSGLIRVFREAGVQIDSMFHFSNDSPEELAKSIQFIVDSLESLGDVTIGIIKQLNKLFDAGMDAAKSFNAMDSGAKKNVGEVLGIGKAIDMILPLITGFAGQLEGLGKIMMVIAGANVVTALTGLGPALLAARAAVVSFGASLGALGSAAIAIGPALAAIAGGGLGLVLYRESDLVREATDNIVDYGLSLVGLKNKRMELRESYNNMSPMIKKYIEETGDESISIENHKEKIDEWLESKKAALAATKEATVSTKEETKSINDLSSAQEKSAKATDAIADGTKKIADNAKKATEETKKLGDEIDKDGKKSKDAEKKAKDHEKAVKKATAELTKIDGDTFRAVLDLDVSGIIEKVERIKSVAAGLSSTISTSGSTVQSLGHDIASDGLDSMARWALERLAEEQMEMAKEAQARQNALAEAEIRSVELENKLTEAKLRKVESGEAQIKIDASNIEPELQLVLAKIIKLAHVRANSEGQDYLLGM